MATIFRNLFRHKKSQSKDDPIVDCQDGLNRDSARRSLRSSKSRMTRFADDNMLPATAAYHTTNVQKLRKGPQSCPGGYSEEVESSSRSFVVDHHNGKENRRRDGGGSSSRHHDLAPSSSQSSHHPNKSVSSSSHHRYHRDQPKFNHYSRWETSEYGSENTSPIGGNGGSSGHHRHYETHLDDDDDEEFEYEEPNKYVELKQRYRRHYENKLNDYEMRRRDDRRKIKELEKEKQTIEKEKNDVVKIMIQQNDKLEKEKKKVEHFKRKLMEMEQQMRSGYNAFSMFPTTPHHQPSMFASFGSNSSGPSQRFSFMSSNMRPISSSNTPTTSAMDTSGGGAGESLVPASDLSLIQLPPMQSIHMELPANVPSSGPLPHFGGFQDDEEDEIKNFRVNDAHSLSLETPRTTLESGSSFALKGLDDSTLTTLTELKDEGYSTTPDDVNAQNQMEPKNN